MVAIFPKSAPLFIESGFKRSGVVAPCTEEDQEEGDNEEEEATNDGRSYAVAADGQTHRLWRPVPGSHYGIMLINDCRLRRVPDNLDRSLKTGENGRERRMYEEGTP